MTRMLRAVMPTSVRLSLRNALSFYGDAVSGVKIAKEPRSVLRYVRLLRLTGEPVAVSVREIDGPVLLRPNTSDARVAWSTFDKSYHLPSRGLPQDATILDLGGNIGLTAAHYASLYPHARIIAVEMNNANAALARRNTERWRDRVTIIEAAVWWETTQLAYAGTPGNEYGFRLTQDGGRTVDAIALSDLVTRYGPIDFLKMDIEGAEGEVLTRATSWADDVRMMQVEVHGDYTVEACERDLLHLGFETAAHGIHWASVNAVSPDLGTSRAGRRAHGATVSS
jgi:FkbM family methyltransferase